MAIRLNGEQTLHAVVAVLFIGAASFLAWLVVWTSGCATVDVEDVVMPVTGADLSNETTTIVPVSARDVGGDVTVFTLVGTSAWTFVALLGLLWAFCAWQIRQHNTTTGALDRVISVVKSRHHAALVNANYSDATELRALKLDIQKLGHPTGILANKPDRHELRLCSRLARQKK